MLRKVGIAQKKRVFDFDFWIIGGIFMKKFVAGVVALTIAFGGMALPAESGFAAVSANAEEMSEANVDVQAASDWLTYGDFEYVILDNGTIKIENYTGKDEKVVIPSTINGKKVTSIGSYTFSQLNIDTLEYETTITSITIPNSVTNIANSAFCFCNKLTSITIPNSVTSIGEGAFFECTSLKSIKLPDGITSFSKNLFSDCESLTSITISNKITSIGDSAFSGCSSLANITIPNNVKSIGNGAFSGCSSLIDITIPKSITNIDNNTFCNCTSLKNVTIPDSVTSIGINVFGNCTSLESITIPESVTSLGGETFRECTNLKNVTLPSNIDYIPYMAFMDCVNLKNLPLYDNITTVQAYAFYGCNSITSVTLPEKVSSIGEWAFKGCINLESITIPKKVTSIDAYAFADCNGLKDVYYKGTKKDWNKITIDVYNDYLLNATIHYSNGELTVDKVKTTKFTCTDKAVKINWEKVNGAAGYRVYAYNAKTKKWGKAATVSASTLSFKQTGLKSGTTYKYKVKAYAKQSGKTYWGEASDTMTTTTKPAQPAIKSTSASTSAVRLNWNAVSGANGYRVVRYDANAKKWVSVGTIKTTSFKEKKLKGKTSYKYKVKAYRKVGGATYWSEYSAVKSVKTK